MRADRALSPYDPRRPPSAPATVTRSTPSRPATSRPATAPRHPSPLYARVAERLRQALAEGTIPRGAVLLEGHIADILQITRTPIRQALHELESEGLVSRFEGRGVVAGPEGTPPLRIALTAAMLHTDAEPVRKAQAWEVIYHEVERDVVHLSVFDRYRINEVELARHFGVGRTVARDVLMRLESLGLIEKDERQRWVVTPLDERRIQDLYELRWLLEPAALAASATHADPAEIRQMLRRLQRAMDKYPQVSRSDMDRLEHDLHIDLLSRCPNQPLLQSLQRTHCILILSKHVLGAAAPMPSEDPFMGEHLGVLNALASGDIAQAQAQLRAHLEESCHKVTQRADFVRTHLTTPKLTYMA